MLTNPMGAALIVCLASVSAEQVRPRPFEIQVVDDATGRGVPLVELETVNNIHYFTDSNGIVAFDEPGLMDQTVFFHVRSHGYEFPKDGFGIRGKALAVSPGGSARLSIKRLNIAERLYRMTGGGIYRDTMLVGKTPPTRAPLLNGLVLGSDSVVNAVHNGKIHWFWGDTNQVAYPLGNFQVPGATSLLPGEGGLDPDRGVDLQYFVGAKGFAKETARMPGDGPTWIGGLVSFRDKQGRERMFANYVKIRNMLETYEHGLVEFDDSAQRFQKVRTFPLDSPIRPTGHTFQRTIEGKPYVVYATPYPLTRVLADADAIADITRYESFSCLKPGTRLAQAAIDRDDSGRIRYEWKANTAPVGPVEEAKLVKSGQIKPDEALHTLRNIETGKPMTTHAGSVYWNSYRNRWVMITVEWFGTSLLGELWYAEADTPLGPWAFTRKILTHDKYSFYNPKQHPMFDKDGGRIIYFEGTYTHSFSGNTLQTPRYDYNQVMYKLDLADPRLNLPVAYHAIAGPNGPPLLRNRMQTPRSEKPGRIAFFALDRPGTGTVPIFERTGKNGDIQLATPPQVQPGSAQPLFHAMPAEVKDAPPSTVPLYEYVSEDGQQHAYSTDKSPPSAGMHRVEKPVCLVWSNPLKLELPPE